MKAMTVGSRGGRDKAGVPFAVLRMFPFPWLMLLLIAANVRADILPLNDLLAGPGSWRAWKGTNDPLPAVADWRSLEQDDSEWSKVVLPVSLDPFFLGSNPVLRDMRGKYTTLFLRRTFVVPDGGANFDSLELNGWVAGGCSVWVNGQEVARALMPPEPVRLGDVALPSPNGGEFLTAQLPDGLVQPGTNVVAVRLLNTALGSPNLYFYLQLFGIRDLIPPAVGLVVPEADSQVNALRQFEVVFTEPVAGVEAADLLANGTPATNVTEVAAGDFAFDLPPLAAGVVTLEFRPDHGITDRSASSNALALKAPWKIQFDPNLRLEQLRITEFLADNGKGLRDEDGNREDWIEIRNFDKGAVPLAGWSLGRDPSGLNRWPLPDRMLSPGEYLVIFASGKNRTNATGTLHTDFKLPKAGGNLLLFKPDGTVAGGFTNYPAQLEDKSYGLVPGITGAAGFFASPTPGGKNSEGGPGFSVPVEFSESSRSYSGSLGVALAASDPLAQIRYTLDQTEPTTESPLYTGPMVFTNVAIVRARTYTPGLLPGPVRTEAFFPISPNLGAFTSTLPVVVINDFGGGRPPLSFRIPAFVQVFEPGKDGVTRLLDAPTLTSRAGIATRGSSTAGNPKPNLRLEFRDEVDEDRKLSFAGLPADGDWILYAPSAFDPALINNAFAYQLSRDIGRYAPRTKFVEVYMVMGNPNTPLSGREPLDNKHYMGVYILEERIELGSDRVDVQPVAPGATAPPEVTGGYLFKIDRGGGDDGYIFTPRQQVLVIDPPGSEFTPAQQSWLQDYFDRFETALYGPQYKDPVKGYRPFIDVPSWVDHHLLNVFMFNVDALRLSAYFHKPKDGPLRFGPVWDFDRALRSTDGRDSFPKTWRSTSGDLGTDFFNYTWWGRMFADVDFFQAYIDRYQELRRGAFSLASLHALVDAEVAQVVEAQPREVKRWSNRPRGGYPKEILDMKTWMSNRLAFMDGQFVRPPDPRIQQLAAAAAVTFAPTNGTTGYYTLDGTDPRASGGGVAPGAIPWPGEVVFHTNTLLTVRILSPNHRMLTGGFNPPIKSTWSGIVQLPVVVATPPVRLTEVHFNPAVVAGLPDQQELEFLELVNTSEASFDLAGFRIRGGIEFDCPTNAASVLPAGGRAIIARNPVLFATRHPGVTTILGPYTGHLSNGGDAVELQGRFGEPVQRLAFGDSWVPEADGGGYSLVPKYEGADALTQGSSAGWKRSAFPGGSPGALDIASIPDMALGVVHAGGANHVRFRGALGRIYSVHALDGSAGSDGWQLLGTVQAGAALGLLEWVDPQPPAVRFYRVTTP